MSGTERGDRENACAGVDTELCKPEERASRESIIRELMKMLSEGDPEAAEKAMREHIVSSRERTLARLEAYFETGKNKKLRYVRSAVGPLTDISLDSF